MSMMRSARCVMRSSLAGWLESTRVLICSAIEATSFRSALAELVRVIGMMCLLVITHGLGVGYYSIVAPVVLEAITWVRRVVFGDDSNDGLWVPPSRSPKHGEYFGDILQ